MKPFKHRLKINAKTTKEIDRIPNDQSRKSIDHEYQKMILRVLNEVFPERQRCKFFHRANQKFSSFNQKNCTKSELI